MPTDPALTAAITEIADALLYGAAGIALVILLIGAWFALILSDICHQLRRLVNHLRALRDEGIDIHVEAGALGRPTLDAEQIVRGAGFLITLWRKVLRKEGEAVPDADRLTLDLGEAMGVALPTRDEAVSITPRGATVKSGLLPYGSKPIPARFDPETV